MEVRNEGQRSFPGRPGNTEKSANEPLLYRFYYQMTFIRQFEENCLLANTQCRWSSRSASGKGLEVCDVGVINALDSTRDFIFSTHRAHAHFIAYSNDVADFTKTSRTDFDTVSDERGDEQHLSRFHMCTRGGERSLVHKALDVAFACRHQATGAICAVFLDRGTVNQAVLKEFGDICSLWSLPVLFVLTDDGLVQRIGRRTDQPEDEMANAFSCASQFIMGDDVFKVYAFASAAVAYVRNNCGPFLLRLQANCLGARHSDEYSFPENQGEEHAGKDPLQRLGGQLTPQAREVIESFVQERIREAVQGT